MRNFPDLMRALPSITTSRAHTHTTRTKKNKHTHTLGGLGLLLLRSRRRGRTRHVRGDREAIVRRLGVLETHRHSHTRAHPPTHSLTHPPTHKHFTVRGLSQLLCEEDAADARGTFGGTGRPSYAETRTYAYTHTQPHTHLQTNKQTNKQTHTHTHRHTLRGVRLLLLLLL